MHKIGINVNFRKVKKSLLGTESETGVRCCCEDRLCETVGVVSRVACSKGLVDWTFSARPRISISSLSPSCSRPTRQTLWQQSSEQVTICKKVDRSIYLLRRAYWFISKNLTKNILRNGLSINNERWLHLLTNLYLWFADSAPIDASHLVRMTPEFDQRIPGPFCTPNVSVLVARATCQILAVRT